MTAKANPSNIKIDDFDYPLPAERIATHPVAVRDSCRLLMTGTRGPIAHHRFSDLPGLLPADTLLVCNDTRVINARLRFHKPETGALIEVFCLEPAAPRDYALSLSAAEPVEWTCLVGNSKRWKEGPLTMECGSGTLTAERVSNDGQTSRIRFSCSNGMTLGEALQNVGEIPIPPYLDRSTEPSDTVDYQTVFSVNEGSVAAPTAGLHFTPGLLDSLAAAGIESRRLTLHVGAGTFQPVKSATLADHPMHAEVIAVGRDLIAELRDTPRRVIAVGTTSVRTLETLFHLGCRALRGEPIDSLGQWEAYDNDGISTREALDALTARLDAEGKDTLYASTRLLIAPGYRYRVVKGMITNFHQPRSTLLLLVSAYLGGDGRWREVYNEALAQGYRFLSYGDACLFLNKDHD